MSKKGKVYGAEKRLYKIDSTSELLQYFTSNAVTFATADNSIAATGIGTSTFAEGDTFTVSGASESGNNITFTVVSVTANKIIVAETVTAEAAGATVKINQTYIGPWVETDCFTKVIGVINASGACTGYIDQSNDGVTVAYSTTEDVTGGTPLGFSVENLSLYARLRIVAKDVDQTTMLAFLNGRTLT